MWKSLSIVVVCGWLLFAASALAQSANPKASAAAQHLLSYFQAWLTPVERPIISGQQIGTLGDDAVRGFQTYVETLQRKTGRTVGLIGVNFARQKPCPTKTESPLSVPDHPVACGEVTLSEESDDLKLIRDYARMGGIVTVMWQVSNPWTGKDAHDITVGEDFSDLYTAGTPMYIVWHNLLDQLAAQLNQLQREGVTVLFRPLHEQNGKWFWWGDHGKDNHPTPQEYVALWRDMFNYFNDTKRLDNLLWVFSVNRSGTGMLDRDPGASYYDIIGLDYYEGVAPIRLDCTLLHASNKPVALTEVGPLESVAQDPQHLAEYDFLRILHMKQECHNPVYFMAWSSKSSGPQAIVQNRHALELLTHPQVLNLGDLHPN